jgi:hypothetical protein
VVGWLKRKLQTSRMRAQISRLNADLLRLHPDDRAAAVVRAVNTADDMPSFPTLAGEVATVDKPEGASAASLYEIYWELEAVITDESRDEHALARMRLIGGEEAELKFRAALLVQACAGRLLLARLARNIHPEMVVVTHSTAALLGLLTVDKLERAVEDLWDEFEAVEGAREPSNDLVDRATRFVYALGPH